MRSDCDGGVCMCVCALENFWIKLYLGDTDEENEENEREEFCVVFFFEAETFHRKEVIS